MKSIRKRIKRKEGIFNKNSVKKFNYQDRTLSFLRLPLIYKFIKNNIRHGKILEAGCGPSILGLNLLKKILNNKVFLIGIDISLNMLYQSKINSEKYKLSKKTEFINSNIKNLPFKNNFFDGIISNGSFHQWKNPELNLKELIRVLKPNGTLFINDLRRDSFLFSKNILKTFLSKWQKKEFEKSFNSSYTFEEIKNILKKTNQKNWIIKKSFLENEIILKKMNC